MNKIILSVAFMLSTLMLTACGPSDPNNSDNETTQINEATSTSMHGHDPLEEVLSAYLALKNALASDDGKTAQASAKTLLAEIGNVPMDKLTKGQNTTWMKYQKKISFDTEHISETNETEHQREHFVTLSKNMYEVEKAFNTSKTTLYYQFCPMANDGKGAYWLSENEKISNPYMGKKMPACGSIKETITAH
jgi:hypothetical protein